MGAKESVVDSHGRELGKLKSVDGDLVKLQGKEFWLPLSAIETIEDSEVRLRPDYDYLGGPPKSKGALGVAGVVTKLALMGLIARGAMAYRDERKRSELKEKAKNLTEKAKTELQKAKGEIEKARSKGSNGSSSDWTPPSSLTSSPDLPPAGTPSPRARQGSGSAETRPFSTLDLSNRTVSDKELELIAEVTRTFPGRTVRTDAVGVHKPDGNEVGTLRISVDERASSDIELNRLETSTESAEVLAHELIMDLRSQLPPET